MIEELKLVMETLGSLGVEAKGAIMLWMALEYVINPLIHAAVITTIFIMAYKVGSKSLNSLTFMGRVAEVWDGTDWLSTGQKKEIIRAVAEYRKEKYKK